jgi:hypothetical protein
MQLKTTYEKISPFHKRPDVYKTIKKTGYSTKNQAVTKIGLFKVNIGKAFSRRFNQIQAAERVSFLEAIMFLRHTSDGFRTRSGSCYQLGRHLAVALI